MCFDYKERIQRLEEMRRREDPELRRRDQKERERRLLERLDWPTPEETAQPRDEKVPV